MAPSPSVDFPPFISLTAVTSAQLKRGSISFSASGDNTVVSGVAGQLVRVFKVLFTVGAASNITFKDGAGTSLTGAIAYAANQGMVLDFDGEPWFATSAGNAFVMNQSAPAAVRGAVWYTQQ